jgi:hypothetical protein
MGEVGDNSIGGDSVDGSVQNRVTPLAGAEIGGEGDERHGEILDGCLCAGSKPQAGRKGSRYMPNMQTRVNQ